MRLSMAPVGPARSANCTDPITTATPTMATPVMARVRRASGRARDGTPDGDGGRGDDGADEHPDPAHGVLEVEPEDPADRHHGEAGGDGEDGVQPELADGAAAPRGGDRGRPEREEGQEADPRRPVGVTAAGSEQPRTEQVELDHGDLDHLAQPEVRRVGVGEVVAEDRHVPRVAPELVEQRGDPQHDAGDRRAADPRQRGQEWPPVGRRGRVAAVADRLHHRHHDDERQQPEDDDEVPGVGLHAVRAGGDGEDEGPAVAVEVRPAGEEQHEERQQPHPRVPRLGELVRSARLDDEGEDDREREGEGDAAATQRQPEGQQGRREVDDDHAGDERRARRAPERVQRPHRQPEQRSRVRPLHAGRALDASRRADERRVRPEAPDVELGLGHVAGGVPLRPRDRDGGDDRRDQDHDRGADDERGSRTGPRGPGSAAHPART